METGKKIDGGIMNKISFLTSGLLAVCVLVSTSAFANETVTSLPLKGSTTATKTTVTSDIIAANSRAEALKTESTFYSVPRAEMSFFEIGGYRQSETTRFAGYEAEDGKTYNNQMFYFNHSRGLTDDIAIDFSFDYLMRDSSAQYRTTGVEQVAVGLRSTFDFMDMKWVYGAHAAYIPNGEIANKSTKAVVDGEIGFEETVDIAKWGVQLTPTSRRGLLSGQQMYLNGFFEVPIVNAAILGLQAGADTLHLSKDSEQENYAQFYGQYLFDKVSSAKMFIREKNATMAGRSVTDAEVGLGFSRVF